MISGIGAISPQVSTVGGGSATSLFSSGLASRIGGESDIGSSFAAMLSQAAGHAVGTLQQAETMSVKALQGDADMRQVVDSVMSAEQSLQAAIAIRDKIVTAYLEISRMPI